MASSLGTRFICVLRRFQKEAWVGSFVLVLVGTYEQKTLRTCLAEDSLVLFRCAVGVSELSAALGLCVVVGRFVIVLNVACIVRGSELTGSARRAIFALADRYRETARTEKLQL